MNTMPSQDTGAENHRAQDLLAHPTVLVGRGGSGTRLLSQIAMDAGIFLGTDINPTNDSMEWRDVIYDAAIAKIEARIAPNQLHLPDTAAQFLTHAQAILKRAEDRSFSHWGWKLPETIFVLPEVLQAFPGTKVVHMVRHPVTCCLRKQHVTSDPHHRVGKAVLGTGYPALDVDPDQEILERQIMHNTVSWLYQVAAIERLGQTLGAENRYCVVRYEDIFDDWDRFSGTLSDFLGIPIHDIRRPDLNDSRRQAFNLPDPRVQHVWGLCRDVAQRFGYDVDETGTPRS
ncbi:sulfotransferase family protein [Shimia biformata]|uniref:sulfotransferase family protein n=1 Tax=Shimia biformata TaxID=1294299 RepID=UPI001950D9F8|nr:sulfotransferase [Shimia biformata]